MKHDNRKKHLAIDIGNVICHLDFREFNKKFALNFGCSEIEANNFLFSSQKAHDLGYSTLETDMRERLYEMGDYDSANVAALVAEWHKTVKTNQTVMTWLKKLLDNGIEIALVSNLGQEHKETMKTILAPIYDRIIRFFSVDVGARKPTFVFYQTFLNMYPQYKGCVYMDDLEPNIESGKLFGFNSKLFDISKMTNKEIQNKLTEIEKEIK